MLRVFRSMAIATVLILGMSAAARAEEAMDHAELAAQYEQEAKDARAKAQFHKDMESATTA
jgi:hypothetical protein